jgi:hypothetical protein
MMLLVWLFEDKRATVVCMCMWLALVVGGCYTLGVGDNKFLQFGPTESTVVMGFRVDTWSRWTVVSVFCFVNTCMNEFIGNSLNPWIVNTVQDAKAPEIPYNKLTCIIIVQLYGVYCHIMSLVGLSLLFSQIDLLFVRMAAEAVVGSFALTRFLAHKTVVAEGYASVPQGHSARAAGTDAGEKL